MILRKRKQESAEALPSKEPVYADIEKLTYRQLHEVLQEKKEFGLTLDYEEELSKMLHSFGSSPRSDKEVVQMFERLSHLFIRNILEAIVRTLMFKE